MDKILLITSENMGTSAGNVTLVLRRAEAFMALYNTYTEIIVYHGKTCFLSNNVKSESYAISYVNRWSELKNKIIENSPKYVIIYGHKLQLLTYPLHLFFINNKMSTPIFMDVQGCVEERKEYARSFKKKMLYPIYYWNFRLAISNADGAFVVSNELMDNCQKKCLWNHKVQYFKVRCGITHLLDLKTIEKNRNEVRKKYNIDDSVIVFVYSGYRSPWQNIDSIIEEFAKYDKRLHNVFFMFFCNTDDEFEDKLKLAFPNGNFITKLLVKNEYEKTLCACDIGYILRDYNETNRVAFPNKFSDYLSTGLLIGINKALPEPMRVLDINNLLYLDTDNTIDENLNTIKEYLRNKEEYIKMAIQVSEKELLYAKQIENISWLF